jgi:uncharacterized protein (TIGR02452 family)
VLVFRENESEGYKLMFNPQLISFVSVAALYRPKFYRDGKKVFLDEDDAEEVKIRMRTIFNIALENHHDSIILSAFGCGAFKNPPEAISFLFNEIIENEFKDCFKSIVFAIIEDHNSRTIYNENGNILPFCEEFQIQKVKINEI